MAVINASNATDDETADDDTADGDTKQTDDGEAAGLNEAELSLIVVGAVVGVAGAAAAGWMTTQKYKKSLLGPSQSSPKGEVVEAVGEETMNPVAPGEGGL